MLKLNGKQRSKTREETTGFVKMIVSQMKSRGDGGTAEIDISNCIICNKRGLLLCCNSIQYCSKEHQRDDWKTHKTICLKRKPVLVMDELAGALDALDDVAEKENNRKVILSMSLVHEVLTYIHKDFRHILHRADDGSVKEKLSVDIIFRSHMQDYFAGVLLSKLFAQTYLILQFK